MIVSLRPALKDGRKPARPPLTVLVIAFVGAVTLAGADVAHRLWSAPVEQSAPAVIQHRDSETPAVTERRVATTHQRRGLRVPVQQSGTVQVPSS